MLTPLAHESPPRAGPARGFLLSGQGWPYLLVPFIPIAIVLDLAGRRPRR